MTIEPHPFLKLTRPDEIAECWEGVSTDLYRRLWESLKGLPAYHGETPPEPDAHDLVKVWDFFTDAEKEELNRLAAKQDEELRRWED